MRVRTIAATLMATLALSVAAPAATQTPAQAATCAGVWVVVDYGSLGGTSTRCATSYDTGTAALKSAGFSPNVDGGMIVKISGKPSNPDINKAYWSYWHATGQSDGGYSSWSYSNLGAGSYHPSKGNAEGWRYLSLSDAKVPPAAAPPAAEAPTPTPKPTPTPTRSSKPSPTARPTATKKPTATASTGSASASASPSDAARSTAPSTSAAPTPAPTTSAPTATTAVPPIEASELGQQGTGSETPTPGGSPVGALVAGGLVVAGAAGIGGWWWLRGRKR